MNKSIDKSSKKAHTAVESKFSSLATYSGHICLSWDLPCFPTLLSCRCRVRLFLSIFVLLLVLCALLN